MRNPKHPIHDQFAASVTPISETRRRREFYGLRDYTIPGVPIEKIEEACNARCFLTHTDDQDEARLKKSGLFLYKRHFTEIRPPQDWTMEIISPSGVGLRDSEGRARLFLAAQYDRIYRLYHLSRLSLALDIEDCTNNIHNRSISAYMCDGRLPLFEIYSWNYAVDHNASRTQDILNKINEHIERQLQKFFPGYKNPESYWDEDINGELGEFEAMIKDNILSMLDKAYVGINHDHVIVADISAPLEFEDFTPSN